MSAIATRWSTRDSPRPARGRAAAGSSLPCRGLALALALALALSGAGAARADAYLDFNRAVVTNDVRTLSLLLERGMDPDTVNEKGEPALITAARDGSPEVVAALVRARAKVNVKNEFGDRPIMIAALNGRLPIVKLLREAGAEINFPGWTPLQYAALNGHDAIVEYLISTGADLALTGPNGASPLMLAVLSNKPDTVKVLLGYGFDVNTRNDKGETALGWARRKDYKDIEAILRKAGLVTGKRGAGGGYALAREPAEITAGDIVRALEGPIEPQVCTAEGDPVLNCVREQGCGTRLVWLKLQTTIATALDGMTLAELTRQTQPIASVAP